MTTQDPAGSLGMSASPQPAPDASQPVVEVFWRPGCPFCTALRIDLDRRGIRAQWRNIWQDDDARAIVREANCGNETVPTVRVGSQHLTNPSGSEVAEAVRGRPGSVARRRRLTELARWSRLRGDSSPQAPMAATDTTARPGGSAAGQGDGRPDVVRRDKPPWVCVLTVDLFSRGYRPGRDTHHEHDAR